MIDTLPLLSTESMDRTNFGKLSRTDRRGENSTLYNGVVGKEIGYLNVQPVFALYGGEIDLPIPARPMDMEYPFLSDSI